MITVIIPLYNKEKYIFDCIKSVLNSAKTFDIEILIINDSSTDMSLDEVRKVDDNRVKVIDLIENAGPSNARNIGIKKARNEYVFFLDADDLIHPQAIPILIEYIKLKIDYICIGIDFEVNNKSINIEKDIVVSDLNKKSYHKTLCENKFVFTASSVCLKKELVDIIGYFNTESNYTEDSEFWARLSYNYSGIYIENKLSYYRIVDDSLSSQFINGFDSVPILLNTLINQYNINKNDKSVINALKIMTIKYIFIARSVRNPIYKKLISISLKYKEIFSKKELFMLFIINKLPSILLVTPLKLKRYIKYKLKHKKSNVKDTNYI